MACTRAHTHTHEDNVFHRKIAAIRDSSPCCYDNDYIYPKHKFLAYDLWCPPPHPPRERFQQMYGNAALEQHYMEPIDQV